jgi:hypothetical protein
MVGADAVYDKSSNYIPSEKQTYSAVDNLCSIEHELSTAFKYISRGGYPYKHFNATNQ